MAGLFVGKNLCGASVLCLLMTGSLWNGTRAIAQRANGGRRSTVTSDQINGLERDAAKGSPAKQVELANRYFAGDGTATDVARAAFWYEKAANSGDPVAENMMGYLSQAGVGMAPDPVRSLHWYRLAASGGLPDALLNVGLAYLAGATVKRDPVVAADYFRRAFEKGVGVAASYLGTMLLAGIRTPRDAAAAEEWYREGAKMHDPVSEYDLGSLYSTEPGHLHDAGKAVLPLRDAADAAYVPAMHSLALLELHHPELARHTGEARELLEAAENAGYWRSSIVLGVMARDGNGAAVDSEQAYLHFRIATMEGGDEAKSQLRADLKRLSGLISNADIARLDAEVVTWVQQHPRRPQMVRVKEGSTLLFRAPMMDLKDLIQSRPGS